MTLPGCGATPDRAPIHDHLVNRGAQPSPRTASRFADIKAAKFFEAPSKPQLIPPAPAPIEAASEAPKCLTSCRPFVPEVQQVQNRAYEPVPVRSDDYVARPPVDDPAKLKRITEIQPYASYEPDPDNRAENPCENLCPRPDGLPCEPTNKACPEEVVLSNAPYQSRQFAQTVFGWEASNIFHNPIYFQDIALERYGHTYPCWIQPFASVGKFSLQFAGLPYQMAIDPPCKRIYALGYYRPGECVPKLHYQIPWNTKAALTEAGVVTGLIYLFP